MGIRNKYNYSSLSEFDAYYGNGQEQYYRDPDDDLVYDQRGYICPGLVRYGGVKPGVQYQKGGFDEIRKNKKKESKPTPKKKSFTVDGREYNYSAYWGKHVNDTGSTPEQAAAFKKQQQAKYEQRVGEIMADAAYDKKRRRQLMSMKIANQANMASGKGTQAGVPVTLGHWIAAKKDPQYLKDIQKDQEWTDRKLDDTLRFYLPEEWRKQRLGARKGGYRNQYKYGGGQIGGLIGYMFPGISAAMGMTTNAQDSKAVGAFDTSNPWKGPASGFDEEGNWVGTTYYGPSPAERAEKSLNDTLYLKAARDAHEEAAAAAGGGAGFYTIKPRHFRAAKNSEEYAMAKMKKAAWMRSPGRQSSSTWREGGFLEGGVATPLPGGATEFTGRTHEEGGILLDPETEVENGETMDKVMGGKDYFFSNYLTLGGKTFAKRHKELLAAGASQKEIEKLAEIQEEVAGRDKHDLKEEQGKKQLGGASNITGATETFDWDNDPTTGSTRPLWNPRDPLLPASDEDEDTDEYSDLELAFMEDTGVQPDDPEFDTLFDAWVEEQEQKNDADDDFEENEENMTPPNDLPEGSVDEWQNKLYNNITDEDIAPYLAEARLISGYDDFDPRNPNHVSALQNNMILLSRGMEVQGIDVDPTMIGGTEEDYLSGDLTVHSVPQGIDGLYGRDTHNALMAFSEARQNTPEQTPLSIPIATVDEIPSDYVTPELPPHTPLETPEEYLDPIVEEEDPIAVEEDPIEEETDPTEETQTVEDETVPYNKPRKGWNWDNILGIGAAAAQLIPAYMAMREKPDYMGYPGRIPTVHLDRVRYNDARAENAANFHGMGKFIEQSGLGPGGISNKMAAWNKKQTGDAKIDAQEARANAEIDAKEEQLNLRARMENIKNSMYIDEFNAAADAANKDRRLMGVQNAVQSLANMNRDRMLYKAERYKAGAIEGTTGVRGRYDRMLEFAKSNPQLAWGSNDFLNAFHQSELSLLDNPGDYYQPNELFYKKHESEKDLVVPKENEEQNKEVLLVNEQTQDPLIEKESNEAPTQILSTTTPEEVNTGSEGEEEVEGDEDAYLEGEGEGEDEWYDDNTEQKLTPYQFGGFFRNIYDKTLGHGLFGGRGLSGWAAQRKLDRAQREYDDWDQWKSAKEERKALRKWQRGEGDVRGAERRHQRRQLRRRQRRQWRDSHNIFGRRKKGM